MVNNSQIKILRVPEVTLIFWIIKVLSTTVGETAADFLSFDLGYGMITIAFCISFIIILLLFLQFFELNRYIPINYWSIIISISILGTLITDILVDNMGIKLSTLSTVFTFAMVIGFLVWYKNEKTLSIHSIDSAKREIYYWVIILLAFALGTGLGDLISESMHLGYLFSFVLFSIFISFVVIGHYIFRMNSILSFWLAFILTRPLGASFGDYLTQSTQDGGLEIDMIYVNLFFLVTIVGLVSYLQIMQKKINYEN